MKVFLTVLFCFFSSQAFALPGGYDFLSFRPATDGGSYFSLWDSTQLKSGDIVAGTLLHYAHRPLRLTQNGARFRGVIDHAFIQEFYGSVGIWDRWLSAGLTLPVAWYLDFLDPAAANPTADGKMAFGDFRLNLKTQLFKDGPLGLGMALVPFMTIPTGSADQFVGSKSVTGGAIMAVEMRPFDRLRLGLNVGLEEAPSFDLRNAHKAAQLLLMAGSHLTLPHGLEGVVEVVSSGRLSGLYQEEVESPLELRGGVKYAVGESGFKAILGGGAGLVHGSRAAQYRFFTGLTYALSPRKARPFVNKKVLYFDFDSTLITKEGKAALAEVKEMVARKRKQSIMIRGYTDTTGSESYNENLSLNRAKAVKRALIEQKIFSGKIKVEGHDGREPVSTNETRDGRARNRRVEVLIQ